MDQSLPVKTDWGFAKKLFFRFGFLFFVTQIVFQPGNAPYDIINSNIHSPLESITIWIGKHMLHIGYEINPDGNGSSDTTYDYLLVLLLVILSIAGTIIWTLIDSKRKSYRNLNYWLVTIVRYYLAFSMFYYGFVKMFNIQFPFPPPHILLQTYGNSSPMRLAWQFFGYSSAYNYFIGLAEIIGGALLLFKRTACAGALFCLVVSVNIMAVNYSFDVCVKLFSTLLVIMSLFLVWQDLKQLINFFWYNKITQPANRMIPVFRNKRLARSLIAAKYILILFTLYQTITGDLDNIKKYGDHSTYSPLYGIYDVKTFIKNNDTLLPVLTDTIMWRRLIVTSYDRALVRSMNDNSRTFTITTDTVLKNFVLTSRTDTANKSNFAYTFIGNDSLQLHGKWKGDSVRVYLKKYDLRNFALVNRGFHFINETPYNR
ncbi:MAG: hypothetical protein ABI480_05715 [Chitinophagaceae bacterium]